MNRWKHTNKKSKKHEVISETADELPDVIADLNIESGNSFNISPVQNQNKENCINRSEVTINSHFNIENNVVDHMQNINTEYNPNPFEDNIYLGRMSKRDDNISMFPINSNAAMRNYNTPNLNYTEPDFSDKITYNETVFSKIEHSSINYSNDFEAQRYRSMSSEPRSPARNKNNDKRTRCSSATRVNQNHSQQNRNIEYPAAAASHSMPRYQNLSPYRSPNLSPPVSPQFQRHPQHSQNDILHGNGNNQSAFTNQNNANQIYADTPCTSPSQNSHISNSYGYKIPDLEAMLTHASISSPANLPMVLGCSTVLHDMRSVQEQNGGQIPSPVYLPLGIIVNAVFKTRDWLYVQTAHGAEGYVPYKACLPLGILPNKNNSCKNSSQVENLAWECNGREDVHHISKENTMKFHQIYNTEPHSRSRPRVKRRPIHQPSASANQTDSQKLFPVYNRTIDNRRRIVNNPQTCTPHLV